MQPSDIVDAEFETVRDPSSSGRANRSSSRASSTDRPGGGLAIFAATRRSIEAARKPMPLPVFALVATLSACTAFYVAGGHALFAKGHGTARTAMAPSFQLTDTSTRIDTSGHRPVLVVRGRIQNADTRDRPAPTIAIRFERFGGGGPAVHTVTLGEIVAAGASVAFTSHIPAGDYSAAPPRVALLTSR